MNLDIVIFENEYLARYRGPYAKYNIVIYTINVVVEHPLYGVLYLVLYWLWYWVILSENILFWADVEGLHCVAGCSCNGRVRTQSTWGRHSWRLWTLPKTKPSLPTASRIKSGNCFPFCPCARSSCHGARSVRSAMSEASNVDVLDSNPATGV